MLIAAKGRDYANRSFYSLLSHIPLVKLITMADVNALHPTSTRNLPMVQLPRIHSHLKMNSRLQLRGAKLNQHQVNRSYPVRVRVGRETLLGLMVLG